MKKEKVIDSLRKVAGQDTDWSWPADKFVEWLLKHQESQAMEDFIDWIEPQYYEPDEYGEVSMWDFFCGWNSVEEFADAWFANEQERKDFLSFCEVER